MQHQKRIYVRAPGPGAIIRLAERFAGTEPWMIAVTPADAKTGYRCVTLSGCDADAFACHLATSLMDIVYLIELSSGRLMMTSFVCVASDVTVARQTIVDQALPQLTFLSSLAAKRTLKRAGLPLWAITIERLKRISYETIAVLDQRDLLVEAPDVVYIAQGNTPE